MGAGEVRDGVALTNLDQPLFDGAGATKRDLVDYLDAMSDRILPDAARPAAVGDPGAARPATVHAEERPEVHAGLGAHGRRCGRSRRSARSPTRCATTAARCSGSPTSARSSTTRRCSAPTSPTTPTHLVLDLDPPEGDEFRLGRAGRAAGPAGAGRRRPAGRGQDQRRQGCARVRAARRRRPSRRSRPRPARSPPAPSGSTRRWPPPRSSGRTAAARCSSTRPGPAAPPWSRPTARGCGPACRCRSRWPGTSSTTSSPRDFTVHTAPALLGRRATRGRPTMPAPQHARRRPRRRGPGDPDRPRAGDARGQAPRPRAPAGRRTGRPAGLTASYIRMRHT